MSKTYFRGSLMATTVMASLVLAGPAFAQVAPEQPAQDPAVQTAPTDQTPATQESVADSPDATTAEEGQDVVVTGSRIQSPNIVSLAPVQVVGETEIDQAGAINIQEVLLENPAFGTPGLSRTNSAFLTSGGGVATVDLRDLGSDRTLVLINSRRVVAGLPGSATVDLNVIPTQFVERIDILTGGASSLYGSDAVAGVVNFLYKRNFSGLLAEGQYGITERGDSARYQVSLTGGGNFADDRGNLMVHLGYTNEKGLLSRDRRNTRVDAVSRFFYITGEPEDYAVSQEPFLSGFAPQGRFFAGDEQFTYGQNGELLNCFSTNGTTCGGAPNGFNRQEFRTLAVPVQRYLFATRGTFDLSDSISAFAEGTYAKTSSSREIEPFALDSSDIFPSTGGQFAIETLVNGGLVLNPLVPAEIAAAATDTDGDGLRDIAFTRRLAEVGSRTSQTTRDFFRFVVGLEGKLLNDRFSWDLSYNFGQTTEGQTSNGQVNVLNFANALRAVPGPNGPVCVSADAVAQGCVPISVFGAGSITPQALNYINAEQSYRTEIQQQVLAANISGAIIDLPYGPLGLAVGAEYRKEESSEDNDALTNAGLNAGNAIPDTEGKFNVKEAYAEINVPILADLPFAKQLNLRAAGRISDYSTVGSVKTYSLGADYAPVEALRFRGTYARAVRAPNIGELFTGPSQTFPTGLQDPCEGITAGDAGTTLGDQCLSDPGVALNVAANGAFTLNQADQQGISGFNAGNPNLDVETAKTFTVGLVINPRQITALRNLVLSVDYYSIKIDDAITFPGRTTILDQCFNEGNDAFCQFITRRATNEGANSAGSLEFINSGAVNSGGLKTRGIDTVLSYRTGLDRFITGVNMNARISWTHLLEGFSRDLPGAPKDRFAGEIGTAKDRVNGSLGFNSDRWGLSFTGTYIGKSLEDDATLDQFGLERDVIKIDPEFYLDAQATFTPTRAYELFLGVDNLLDNDAPDIIQGSPFNVTGSDTAADVYDIFGRRFYAGVRLRF
ncbi:MAG TPA: TonB-dependent receptor [Sphingomicrobium sp.]|nr:TonB-dependent receptor [Sphingomicrobium sp.]